MDKKEQNAYILGTDHKELYRLGLQHQVWASEAQQAWKLAGFTAGHTLLDLGCGPGFCTKELAFITGNTGKVLAVDKSTHYISYLKEVAKLHQLHIEAIQSDFEELRLAAETLDGMFCRWALAWLDDCEPILKKVMQALKKGGKMVIHEYYDWTTHQIEPRKPALSHAIRTAFQSFADAQGEIDIGRQLPHLLSKMGLKVVSTRLMPKLANPQDLTWQWPKSFYQTYFPKLVETNYLTTSEMETAFKDLEELEKLQGATLCCPLMIEIIAEKIN